MASRKATEIFPNISWIVNGQTPPDTPREALSYQRPSGLVKQPTLGTNTTAVEANDKKVPPHHDESDETVS